MGIYSACLTDSRAFALEPIAGCKTTCGAANVRVCTCEQHTRKQLTSAGAPECSVPGPKLFLYYMDDLLCRLDNIYSASAFMYADGLTIVASGASIHACAAAMQPALSLVSTWAAEHNLKINVDKSEAALFHISSHTRSDEDMVDLLLGSGKLRIQSRPVRLLGTTFDRPLNFVTHASIAAKQTVPRRCRLRLVAQAGASHHTMRSFLIGYVHGVLFHNGEAIVPCLAPTYRHHMEVRYRDSCEASLGLSAATEDTSVCLEANLLPLRRYSGSVHSHNMNVIYASTIMRICVSLSTRNLCLRPCMGKRRHRSRFREMLILMNYTASVTLLGYPTTTIALLLPNLEYFTGTL
ncbi:hypothetical protein MOQ_003868 [Trypanosoma cruzi marinkellei]|uniref:Reverse transcriptase domain-containing protein n=1 Tax=Trypanosoma cruzi marinkellei TaxID=85056 RepID=K2MYX0_TRYCR|nr:hypothetical protein MOQ_003868 [Trypanosoma cruzi marinkellei]